MRWTSCPFGQQVHSVECQATQGGDGESGYVWFLAIGQTIIEATMDRDTEEAGLSVPLIHTKVLLAENLPDRETVSPREALAWLVGLPHDALDNFHGQSIDQRCKARIGLRHKPAQFWVAIFEWLADGEDGVVRDCPWSELAHITDRRLEYSQKRQIEIEGRFRRAATVLASKHGKDFRHLFKDWSAILKQEVDLGWSLVSAALNISAKLPSLDLDKRYGNRLEELFSDQGSDRHGYRLSFQDESLRQAGWDQKQGMVELFTIRNSDAEEVLIENLELPRDALIREFITKPDQECAVWLQQLAKQDMWTPNALIALIYFDFDVKEFWRREHLRRSSGNEYLYLGADSDIWGNSGGAFHHILDDLLGKLRTGALKAYYRPTPKGLSSELLQRDWADRFLHFLHEKTLFAHAKRILPDDETEYVLTREGIEIVGFDREKIFQAFPDIPQAFSDFAAELGFPFDPPLIKIANASTSGKERRAEKAAEQWVREHKSPWQIRFKDIFKAVDPEKQLGKQARKRIQAALGLSFPGLSRSGPRHDDKPGDWKPLESQLWRN